MGYTVRLGRGIHFKECTLTEEPDAESVVAINTLMGKGGESNKVRTVGSPRHQLLVCSNRDHTSLAFPKFIRFPYHLPSPPPILVGLTPLNTCGPARAGISREGPLRDCSISTLIQDNMNTSLEW